MPLYMDYHVFPDVTIEDVKLAHIADQAVQDKYGVTYHQFWVNESAGTVFCLMEGPDKESCAKVHREAHGNVACELIEVEPGFYELLMGKSQKVDHGLVLHKDGSVDQGYRFVAVVNVIGNTDITHTTDYKDLLFPTAAKEMVRANIARHKGRELQSLGEDSIIGTFTLADQALQFALDTHRKLRNSNRPAASSKWDVSFTTGISGGQPLRENEGLFEDTIRWAHRLSMVAENGEMVLSNLLSQLCTDKKLLQDSDIRTLRKKEEGFLDEFFIQAEKIYLGQDLGVRELSQAVGLSRPQLYRKINAITGRSPISFLRDLKMKRALTMLRENTRNVSEVALELGYNNPSYFAKCFHKKYGVSPSKINS